MVDFRYHLVSLVSVFLALALGIILGAGPLQNSIGDTLSGQVETLRTSRDEARAELALTQTQLEGSEAALNLAGEQLLPETLTDRNVALVVLPGTNADVVDGLEAELELSGAKISAQVKLTASFVDSGKATYRGALAAQLKQYVTDLPSNPSNDQVVAAALDMVLRSGPENADAKVLLSSLTSDKDALFLVDREITGPADAVVVITPKTLYPEGGETLQAEEQAEVDAQDAMYVKAFATIAGRGPTVALGRAVQDTDLLTQMRALDAGSTVDSAGSTAARINVPLALASELTNKHVALGSQNGAEAALGVRIESPRPALTPTPAPETPAEGENATGEGGAGEGEAGTGEAPAEGENAESAG
ncbi:MAG: copper transporter [Ancrocorticia sp.]